MLSMVGEEGEGGADVVEAGEAAGIVGGEQTANVGTAATGGGAGGLVVWDVAMGGAGIGAVVGECRMSWCVANVWAAVVGLEAV